MANIGREQARALADGFLNDLGSVKDTSTELPIVIKMLQEGAKLFLDTATKYLEPDSSGELSKELTFRIEQESSVYTLTVGYPQNSKAAKYYDYINKGVKGLKDKSGATGDYKFKTPFANNKMATALLLWYRRNGAKARSTDVQKYGPHGAVETKARTLSDTIKKVPSLKELAYATAVKVKRDGIKPKKYFDRALSETFDVQFLDTLRVALGADVRLMIRQLK